MAEEFEQFFSDHYEPVVRSLTLVFGDRARAEDAAQTGFERAYRKWRSVSQLDRPATWAYVVALRDARREVRREPQPEAVPDAPGPSVEDEAVAAVLVETTLALLPLRQRLAIVLRHLAGLSVPEVAEAMGCAEGTVKATLHAAHRRMRVMLDEEVSTDAG